MKTTVAEGKDHTNRASDKVLVFCCELLDILIYEKTELYNLLYVCYFKYCTQKRKKKHWCLWLVR